MGEVTDKSRSDPLHPLGDGGAGPEGGKCASQTLP